MTLRSVEDVAKINTYLLHAVCMLRRDAVIQKMPVEFPTEHKESLRHAPFANAKYLFGTAYKDVVRLREEENNRSALERSRCPSFRPQSNFPRRKNSQKGDKRASSATVGIKPQQYM